MNVEKTIRDLVETHLADNHQVEGVRFVEEILWLASQVGQIRCCLAGNGKLRFEISPDHVVEVELGRAKSKLRLLCARLSVLCNEAGQEDITAYGGEGIITMETHPVGVSAGAAHVRTAAKDLARNDQVENRSPVRKWTVRFKNTMDKQEFTIVAD